MNPSRSFQPLWIGLSAVFYVTFPMFAGNAQQRLASFAALVVTAVFVGLVDRYGWTPLIKKAGFWFSSALLAGALALSAILLVTLFVKFDTPDFGRRLLTISVVGGLLFSWALSAMRCVEKRKKFSAAAVKPAMSRLFRGARRQS